MTTTVVDLTTLSDDDLEAEVVTWAGRVNAGHARMLAAIGEIDARGSWFGEGWLTCAHWLSVKLGLSRPRLTSMSGSPASSGSCR